MGHRTKDDEIWAETEATDEPVIVFRAKDLLSTMVIGWYQNLVAEYGYDPEFEADVAQVRKEFVEWQRANPSLVKLPD